MKHHERVTFNQGQEILQHSVDYLRHVNDQLDAVAEREHPERVRMLLESYRIEQRNLLGAIERFQEDAPDRVLNTYSQYSVELPAELAGPEEPLSTLTLTRWLMALNQHLVSMFTELADSGKTEALRGIFATLSNQVQAHDRRLSKEYQRFEDL
jgi:rubrerythrin